MATYVASAHLVGDDLHQTDYEVGQQVRLDLSVFGATAAPADPGSGPILKLRDPLGNVSTPSPTRDGTGLYHYDLTLATAGTTAASWTGTGANAGGASLLIGAEPKAVP